MGKLEVAKVEVVKDGAKLEEKLERAVEEKLEGAKLEGAMAADEARAQ